MTKFSEFLAANTGSACNGEVELYTENQVLRAFDWDEGRIRAIRWHFDNLRSWKDDVYIESESNEDLLEQVEEMYIRYLVETRLIDEMVRVNKATRVDPETLVDGLISEVGACERFFAENGIDALG
jgi:hypothetical protein